MNVKRSLYCLFLLTLLPAIALAKPWKELTPGVSKKGDVVQKFGPPTREITRTGEFPKGLVYQGTQAMEGTKQAQFFMSEDEIVQVIYVFPKTDLTRDQIIKNYGENFEEKLNDSFKTYFYYKNDGLVVYFQEDNKTVSSLTFQKPGT